MRTIVLTIVVALSVALLSTVLIEAQPLTEELLQQDEPQGKDSASKEKSSEETKNQGKTKREAAVYLTQGGGPYSPNGIRLFSRKEYRTLPNGNIAVEKSYYFANGTKVPPSALEGRMIVDSSSQESSSEEGVMRVLGKREANPQGLMKQANGPGMYGYPGRFGGGGIIVDSSSQGVSSSEERRAMWARGKREAMEQSEETIQMEKALARLERSPKKKHDSSSSLYSQLYGY